MADIVRTPMFETDIGLRAHFGRTHLEFLGAHPPATSKIEVSHLIGPDMMIEIEADAVCAD